MLIFAIPWVLPQPDGFVLLQLRLSNPFSNARLRNHVLSESTPKMTGNGLNRLISISVNPASVLFQLAKMVSLSALISWTYAAKKWREGNEEIRILFMYARWFGMYIMSMPSDMSKLIDDTYGGRNSKCHFLHTLLSLMPIEWLLKSDLSIEYQWAVTC